MRRSLISMGGRKPKRSRTIWVEEAVASLNQAKAMHDELEAIYNPHVDFSLVDQTAQDIWGEIQTF